MVIALFILATESVEIIDLWWSLLGLVVGWGSGFGLGYYVGGKRKKKMNPKMTAILAVVVTVIWSLSMLFDAFNPAYDPPAPVHGAFMLVLGGVFGARLAGRGDS